MSQLFLYNPHVWEGCHHVTNVLIGVNNKDGSSLVCSKVGVVYGSQNVGLSPQDWCLFFWASLCLTDGTVVLASGGRERVDDMQQRATGWNRTRTAAAAALYTGRLLYYPLIHQRPIDKFLNLFARNDDPVRFHILLTLQCWTGKPSLLY